MLKNVHSNMGLGSASTPFLHPTVDISQDAGVGKLVNRLISDSTTVCNFTILPRYIVQLGTNKTK